MIISYYEQAFFGGGTFYKLSKESNEDNFKYQYIHSAVPNYVPNAEEYLRNYEDLRIIGFKKELENKLHIVKMNSEEIIDKLLSYAMEVNWNEIAKRKYSDNNILDGLCWTCYIEIDSNSYLIDGYEEMPTEIKNVIKFLDKIKNACIKDDEKNEFEKKIIEKNKKSNINIMKFLNKKGILPDEELKEFIDSYKK